MRGQPSESAVTPVGGPLPPPAPAREAPGRLLTSAACPPVPADPSGTPAPPPAAPRDTRPPTPTPTPTPSRRSRPPEERSSIGPDHDLPAAVERVLAEHLAERRQEAARISDRFAADIVTLLADFVLGGGKRLRPAFLWWAWRACGGPPSGDDAEAVLRAAAALELIQACALIHDDLMDGSPLRRNAPAAHVVLARRHRAAGLRGDPGAFGAGAALLAGDLALAWADDLWHGAGLAPSAQRRARGPWQAMRTEMVAGQYLDLYGQARGGGSAAAALEVAHLKSGLYTVERPLHLGAVLAGAPDATVAALRRAGRAAGLAFQLRDDLLGVFGSPDRTGKPAGEDITEGKPTYLMAVALRRARARGDAAVERELLAALGSPGLTGARLDRVRSLVTATGARAHVERVMERLVGSALDTLDRAPLERTAVRHLSGLARSFVPGPPP
ncbi:polyprenyl synthetase family protein [Streptomyces thermolineatus]|uniref:Polyprenyl synthetase family protein n=1 Tax=Streptomyces thermolineatus TaxID=44033 RepID=A0ABN3M2Q2_9ACTN